MLAWSGFSNPGCFSKLHKYFVWRPAVVIPDQSSTSCQQCNTTMKVTKCRFIFHCTLTFENMKKRLNLPLEVLQSYLQQDVIKLRSKENIKSFKDSLHFIEKIDYFHNTKNLMKKHWPTLFPSLNFNYKIYFLGIYYFQMYSSS